MKLNRTIYCLFIFTLLVSYVNAEDGHQLWLRTRKALPVMVVSEKKSATLTVAQQELQQGWQGMPGAKILLIVKKDNNITGDGFKISPSSVQANTDVGVLYGVYEMLRRQQTGEIITEEISNPSYTNRVLNHWDNLDGSIERGYAGNSIFWRKDNPFSVTAADQKLWREYARANASIGINGAVLDNVNASPLILDADYLVRTKAIAEVLRPYGVKVYLAVKFSSPE